MVISNESFLFFLCFICLISYVPHLFCLEESQNLFCLEDKNLSMNLYTFIKKKKMCAQISLVNKD